MKSHQIAAGEFKAKCLQLLDAVAGSGESLTITKRGRPVARLVPMPATRALFGALAGSVVAQERLLEPVGDAWEADAGDAAA